RLPSILPSFPTRRSSDLEPFSPELVSQGIASSSRLEAATEAGIHKAVGDTRDLDHLGYIVDTHDVRPVQDRCGHRRRRAPEAILDRKSTRLNSSHRTISY